jgi:predicted nuclease of restriction endonuclease-like RecB superfamily
VKAIVRGRGNLGEFECICRDVVKQRFFLVHDEVFEATDGLVAKNFDWKDLIRIIAESYAMGFQ